MNGWDYAIAVALVYGVGLTFGADLFWEYAETAAGEGDEKAELICRQRARTWLWLSAYWPYVIWTRAAAGVSDARYRRKIRKAAK